MDTNVLVLLIAGKLQPALIGQHRRLRVYDETDFDIVEALARQYDAHISTPHILAETSNFLGSGRQHMVEGGVAALTDYIAVLDEIYAPAKTIAEMPEMSSLGLTDAGIVHLSDQSIQVVSMDFHLCNRLHQKGVAAVNPRHYRS